MENRYGRGRAYVPRPEEQQARPSQNRENEAEVDPKHSDLYQQVLKANEEADAGQIIGGTK